MEKVQRFGIWMDHDNNNHHSNPKGRVVSCSFVEEKKDTYLSSDEDTSDNLECFSSIYPLQPMDENKKDSFNEEAYIWSQLKESGAILEQLIQLEEKYVSVNAQEEQVPSSASSEDMTYEWDSFEEETKPCLLFPVHRMVVDEFHIQDTQDSLWSKLLRLFLPNSTLPIGCLKFVMDKNLFSASLIRNCFQLLCCPLCNSDIASNVDLSKLCQCLLYLFDRRTLFGKETLSISPCIIPEWVPSWQDFEKWISHHMETNNNNNAMESSNEENIQRSCLLSTWKRILSFMATCLPFVTYPCYGGNGRLEDIPKAIQLMTRILLDPFGKSLRRQVCWVLHRCWVLLGGTCQQLTCLVNEYFVTIFLKHATSIVLQWRLVESLDSSLQPLSQFFAYKLFMLHTKEECLIDSIREQLEYQLGNFLVSFLKENLVYGADIQQIPSRMNRIAGTFQKFVYPLVFEMKDSSSSFHHRVDMLSTHWQFCENTWSEHEITSFHPKQVQPQYLMRYRFKQSFQPSDFVDWMEYLCRKPIGNCETLAILIRFALLAIQPSLLFQMEYDLRERLRYAISILKSSCGGFVNLNSSRVAMYLSHMHMIAECLCHSVETSHSGVLREQQLTLWFTRKESS